MEQRSEEPPEDAPDAPPVEPPGGSEIVGVTSIDDGQWHHVAVVFKAETGTAQLFVDGQWEGEEMVEVADTESSGPVVLGQDEGETPHSKDFKVFWKALSPWQINGLMTDSKDLGTGLTLSMLPDQVDEYWRLKAEGIATEPLELMVCPLCLIPPAVAGLWGGALLAAPKSEGRACEHCDGQGAELAGRGGKLSAALGVAGALPLAYLGFRRWRRGRLAVAAGCFASSSLVLGLCAHQLFQVAKAREPTCTEAAAIEKLSKSGTSRDE
eukprot:s1093_g4.t1